VSVKNTGEKTIKLVDWDYVFFNTATQSETGRLEFTSDEKIGPVVVRIEYTDGTIWQRP
jgi:hypothetical protein